MDQETRCRVVMSLVMPQLDYGNALLSAGSVTVCPAASPGGAEFCFLHSHQDRWTATHHSSFAEFTLAPCVPENQVQDSLPRV